MILDFVKIFPLRENIETFNHIYKGLLDNVYTKEYLDHLVNLSEIFYNSLSKVLLYKELLKVKTKELQDSNTCDLTRLILENEIDRLTYDLNYLLGNNTNLPYDESQIETSQEILQFYFDSKESKT
jgi:hypothetical protein